MPSARIEYKANDKMSWTEWEKQKPIRRMPAYPVLAHWELFL